MNKMFHIFNNNFILQGTRCQPSELSSCRRPFRGYDCTFDLTMHTTGFLPSGKNVEMNNIYSDVIYGVFYAEYVFLLHFWLRIISCYGNSLLYIVYSL